MQLFVRDAHPEDAEAISQVIITALRVSNARDYTPEVIRNVERSFSPQAVHALLQQRRVFVALSGDTVVGTASLDGAVVRSVFVEPACQGKGLGRLLMRAVEEAAIASGVECLSVPSSVTAQAFYTRLGFEPVREVHHGEERTIVMQRRLI